VLCEHARHIQFLYIMLRLLRNLTMKDCECVVLQRSKDWVVMLERMSSDMSAGGDDYDDSVLRNNL
jgi:hypothetical protein